jgi:hypothetical protein
LLVNTYTMAIDEDWDALELSLNYLSMYLVLKIFMVDLHGMALFGDRIVFLCLFPTINLGKEKHVYRSTDGKTQFFFISTKLK